MSSRALATTASASRQRAEECTPSRPAARPRDDIGARRERLMFERCRRGDADARAELVERFLPLAQSLARRYSYTDESPEDLLQVACLGLVKAVDRFDPARGFSFSSFAVPTIAGEIKRYFRDHTWSVHVPRDLNERTLRTEHAIAELTARNGRTPNAAELGEALGMSDEDVADALQARHARRSGSLDAPTGDATDDGLVPLGELIPSDEAVGDYERAEQRVLLAPLLETLSPRDREVLRLRYEEDLTQQEIGAIVGVSQMQVSRIIRSSLARMNGIATVR